MACCGLGQVEHSFDHLKITAVLESQNESRVIAVPLQVRVNIIPRLQLLLLGGVLDGIPLVLLLLVPHVPKSLQSSSHFPFS